MGAALKGIAWDHRRCWGPLDASVGPYTASRPNLTIEWHRRSLHEFGEGRLEDVVRAYDLIVFDHPFVGEVERTGLLIPLDPYLTDRRPRDVRGGIGRPVLGVLRGRRPAVGIAHRCRRPGCRLPAGHPRPLWRAAAHPRRGARISGGGSAPTGLWLGLPLIPTDAMCLILTFAAMAGQPAFRRRLISSCRTMRWRRSSRGAGIGRARASEVVGLESDCLLRLHGRARRCGLRAVCLRLRELCLEGGGAPAAVRRHSGDPAQRRLLGGAGIGISAFCANPREAFDYAMHLCQPEFQRTTYVTAGGQPGMLSAWREPRATADQRFFRRYPCHPRRRLSAEPARRFRAFFRAGAPEAARAFKGEISRRRARGMAQPAAGGNDGSGPHRGPLMIDEERVQLNGRERGSGRRAAEAEYPVPAAEKALDVLEFMADCPEGVTQTEISAGVGRSLHEIYRIIQLLERRGYLVPQRRPLSPVAAPVRTGPQASAGQSAGRRCASGDACVGPDHRPELPSRGARRRAHPHRPAGRIRPCRCATRWRSARSSRCSRRVPAPCSSPACRRVSARNLERLVAVGETATRMSTSASRRRLEGFRDAPVARRRRLHQHFVSGLRPHRDLRGRTDRSISAAEEARSDRRRSSSGRRPRHRNLARPGRTRRASCRPGWCPQKKEGALLQRDEGPVARENRREPMSRLF